MEKRLENSFFWTIEKIHSSAGHSNALFNISTIMVILESLGKRVCGEEPSSVNCNAKYIYSVVRCLVYIISVNFNCDFFPCLFVYIIMHATVEIQ